MIWRVAIVVVFVVGWGLITLGVAELTTPWAWSISAGVLLLIAGLVLTFALASETGEERGGPD